MISLYRYTSEPSNIASMYIDTYEYQYMSSMKIGLGVRFPLALFTVIATAAVANGVKMVLLTFEIPDLYASVLGFAVVTPILVYSISAPGDLQTETYRRERGARGVGVDVLAITLLAAVGGSLGTAIALSSVSAESWQQALGVGFAILAGREIFTLRNREYFDTANPWVAGKLGEWLEKRDR